jgi:Tol biopolymer transport system component
MRRVLVAAALPALLLLALAPEASAQASERPPNTEIYLARLLHRGDSLVISAAQNVTRRAGYDNQPSFLTDASGFLYTAIDSTGQADIWRYEIRTRRRTRVTRTPESEYSPTMMPGSRRFSVVRVERDSTQRLWSFALDGRDPQLLIETLAPVGYHAWLDSFRVAAFVLGAPATATEPATPSTLHVLRRDGSEDDVRAQDIGRALQRIPAQDWYSFVQHDSTKTPWIVAQPFDGGAVSRLVRLPVDDEFFAWAPDGTLLSASGDTVLKWNGVSGDGSAWSPIATMAPLPVRNISRLAVSPDGRWLAFVAEPAGR